MPAGTPQGTVTKVAEAVGQAMNDPRYIAKAKMASVPLAYMNPKNYGRFLKDTDASLAKAWAKTPWIK